MDPYRREQAGVMPEGVHRREEGKTFSQVPFGSLGMRTKSEEMPHQVVCYKAEDESGGLDVEGRRVSEELKPAHPI